MTVNTLDLLFLTPEMLAKIAIDVDSFVDEKSGERVTCAHKLLKAGLALKRNHPRLGDLPWTCVPLLVIDEVHCIAEQGHGFRPEYARVWSLLAEHRWFQEARKLGLTATVNARVRESLMSALPAIQTWTPVYGELHRRNMTLRIMQKPLNEAARVDYIFKLYNSDTVRHPTRWLGVIFSAPLSGAHSSFVCVAHGLQTAYILVFCQSRAEAKDRAQALKVQGVPAEKVSYYFSGKSSDAQERQFLQDQETSFRTGAVHVLFSTCALGLGYDKADIQHVVHLWTPNSMVQYYQEFGRAGRSQPGTQAVAHMLPTSAWNPTGWVAALGDMTWFLKRAPNFTATRAEINDRALHVKRRFKEGDVTDAIKLGVSKGILEESEDGKIVRLVNEMKSTQDIDQIYATHMGTEIQVMNGLLGAANNGTCLWSLILTHFEGGGNKDSRCMRCSGCAPGGDIAPSSQAAGNVFYQVITPTNKVPVFAMCRNGENVLMDDDGLREIFAMHRPTMVMGEFCARCSSCPVVLGELLTLWLASGRSSEQVDGLRCAGFERLEQSRC